jgi:glutathione synthase/RimK-type ligase-like ATP-grasp enzyme
LSFNLQSLSFNLLITGIGGPTPRSLARALRWHSQYKPYRLIGADMNPHARDLYDRELYDRTYLAPPAGHAEYWPALERLIAEEAIEIALVQPELEVLAWAERAEAGGLPCKALLPSHALALMLTDKARMTAALEGTGLAPPSLLVDPAEKDLERVGQVLGYPFWIRATAGSSGLGSLKVENPAALRQWIAINPGVRRFIASQYLPGRNLACKLLYHEGQLARAACAERVHYIMAKVAPSGVTGNTAFGRLLNEPDLVVLAAQAMDRLFAAAGAAKHGFFTVDFKEDGAGRPFVTEVNVRHVAFSLCFAMAGANFAEDTVRLLDGDAAFERDYRMYEFEPGLIFLRDVDAAPVVMREGEVFLNANFREW